MNTTRILLQLLTVLLFAFARSWAGTTPGDADPTFGTNGMASYELGSGGDTGRGIAIQADGKPVVAATTVDFFGNAHSAVVRFGSNGVLDTTFNSTGARIDLFGTTDESLTCAAVHNYGGAEKIVVGGYAHYNDSGLYGAFTLARLNADGSFDTSFASDGTASVGYTYAETNAHNFVNAYVLALAVQPNGKIIAVGGIGNASGNPTVSHGFTLARFETDGALDANFGNAGVVITDVRGDNGACGATGVALQSDGKFVVVGNTQANTGNNEDFGVLRYNADGTLDTDFGTNGVVITDLNTGSRDFPRGVAVRGDGKIFVVGTTQKNNDDDIALVCYNADGTLDTGFGTNGIVINNVENGATASGRLFDEGNSLVLQGDGKILIGGATDIANYCFLRYFDDGLLDSTFGGTGVVIRDPGSRDDFIAGIALQSDGNIVATGKAGNSGDIGVTRLIGGPPSFAPDYPADATATSVTTTGATLQVDVNPGGLHTVAYFEYSTDPALAGATSTTAQDMGRGLDNTPLSAPITGLEAGRIYYFRVVSTNYLGTTTGPIVSFTTPLKVFLATDAADVPGEPTGVMFFSFGAPAIDGGLIGGAVTIAKDGEKPVTAIYSDFAGKVLARTGEDDPEGSKYAALGDPVFGGQSFGFQAMALVPAVHIPSLPGAQPRLIGLLRPGAKFAALYSQVNSGAGLKRLAAVAGTATGGGQFAKFGGFGLPRTRGGLIYTANLFRTAGVTKVNDFGVWREKTSGGASDRLLRTGMPLSGTDQRMPKKLTLMTPVANASDQRRSFAPDGGVGAVATFPDGSSGIVRVAADGSVDVPADTTFFAPDEMGVASTSVKFKAFNPPATASGGLHAFLATLRSIARGTPPPPSSAIFTTAGGGLHRLVARGDGVTGLSEVTYRSFGQPLLGERGLTAFLATLSGRGVKSASNKALVIADGATKTVVARLGGHAAGLGTNVVYRRFLSMVVTDSDPARMVFTATVSGGGVKGSEDLGLWSVSATQEAKLLLREGQPIDVLGQTSNVRTFEALQAPTSSMGQGRSTDANGFVTAKVKLTDGRSGVLRIPLP